MIEITTFRLADGVDEARFLEVDEQVRTGVLYHQPAIVRATTARGEAGEWAVIVVWAGDATVAVGDTDLAPLMDPASVHAQRFQPLD